MSFWILFTKLADNNVLVPLAVMLAGWLVYVRRSRAAVVWLFLFCAGLGIVAASKIAYVGWGIGIASLDFKGFSGHATRAAAVAPVLTYLLLQGRSRFALSITLVVASVFGIAIAISRLILHEHSVSEVISGLLLGSIVGYSFLAWNRAPHIVVLHRNFIAACILIAIPGLLAKPAPTQHWIESVALYLSGHDQPYPRQINNGMPADRPQK